MDPFLYYESCRWIISFLGKHKELKFRSKEEDVLEECANLLNEVKTTYENCVASTQFEKVRSVKPIEPFITKKAYTLLRDILLKEKHYFKELPESGESNYYFV